MRLRVRKRSFLLPPMDGWGYRAGREVEKDRVGWEGGVEVWCLRVQRWCDVAPVMFYLRATWLRSVWSYLSVLLLLYDVR